MTICRTLYLPDNINTLHWYKFATHVSSFTVAIHLLIWPFAMSSEKQWKLNMTKKPFWTFRKSKDQISLLPLDDRLYWKVARMTNEQWILMTGQSPEPKTGKQNKLWRQFHAQAIGNELQDDQGWIRIWSIFDPWQGSSKGFFFQ